MKNVILPLIFISVLISCNQDKIDNLSNQNSELNQQTSNQEVVINEMLASFNEIQGNLNQIKKSEGFITINTRVDDEGNVDANQINRDINLISDLMKKNEELINSLNSKLNKSNIKISEFRKLISGLTDQVEEKNIEIARLNELLSSKNIKIGELYFSIDSLSYNNKVKDKQIQDKVDQINTAYYAYGTYKELKEKNVLTKEGGVLGLGKSQTMKDDFNKEYFSRVDITKQKSFLIYANKARLVTTHPTGSYEFIGSDDKIDSLVITNSEDFWRASKYMVIVVD
jgi:chromosome segregation ATPase